MKYYINATINNLETDNDKLNVLTFLKDTFAQKVTTAKARSDKNEIPFQIIEEDFNTTVSTITTLKNEYGTALTWELDAQDYGGNA